MNDWTPPPTSQMNQQCKVCGEPAAGFHFGAFTCEGCKSFFGRSYNNLSSISECKNGGQCIINKKNRTSCKACRLRKCLVVGMSKSGSRYGRRSNWFKIHCLLQEQSNNNNNNNHNNNDIRLYDSLKQQNQRYLPPIRKNMEDNEYKIASSPSISSPESHNSDSSVEISDSRLASIHKDFFIPFLPPTLMQNTPFAAMAAMAAHQKLLFPPFLYQKPGEEEICTKRFYLDAILQSQQRTPPPIVDQDNPIDLSMKRKPHSDTHGEDNLSEKSIRLESDCSDSEKEEIVVNGRTTPLDLTKRFETAA